MVRKAKPQRRDRFVCVTEPEILSKISGYLLTTDDC